MDAMEQADRHMDEWQEQTEQFDRSTYERFYFMEQLLMGAFSLVFTGPHKGGSEEAWIEAYHKLGLWDRATEFVGYEALKTLMIDSDLVPLYSREQVREILFKASIEIENRASLINGREGYGRILQIELDAAADSVRNHPVP